MKTYSLFAAAAIILFALFGTLSPRDRLASVSGIAVSVGFTDLSAFNKTLRNLLGERSKEIRQRLADKRTFPKKIGRFY